MTRGDRGWSVAGGSKQNPHIIPTRHIPRASSPPPTIQSEDSVPEEVYAPPGTRPERLPEVENFRDDLKRGDEKVIAHNGDSKEEENHEREPHGHAAPLFPAGCEREGGVGELCDAMGGMTMGTVTNQRFSVIN